MTLGRFNALWNSVVVLLFAIREVRLASGDLLQLNLGMDIKTAPDNTVTLFEKTNFYFNADNTLEVSMRPDISFGCVMIGLSEDLDWGVPCNNGGKDTHCYFNQTTIPQYYNLHTYVTYPLNIPNPLKKDGTYNLNTSYLKAYGLYDAVQANKSNFLLGGVGIVGMAPNSPYFSNLFDHYGFEDDMFVFSFTYLLDKSKHWWDNNDPTNYKNGTLSLNGYSESDLVNSNLQTVSIPRSTNFWQIGGVQLLVGNTTVSQGSQTLCITNSLNEILAADSSMNVKAAINSQFCSNQAGCTTDKDSKSAPLLTLKFADFELTLDESDYLFKNETTNTYDQVIADISSWRSLGKCSPESKIAVGRMFFSKYALIFNFAKTGNHKLSFGVKKQLRTLTAKEKIVIVVISITVIGIVLSVLIIKTMLNAKKVKSSGLTVYDDKLSSDAGSEYVRVKA